MFKSLAILWFRHNAHIAGDTVSLNLNLNANKQLAVVKARYQLSWVKQSLFKVECGHSVEYVGIGRQ